MKKNINITEKNIDNFMNLLYDDFVFEEIGDLKKQLESEMSSYKLIINSNIKDEDDFNYNEFNNKVTIEEIKSELKNIYQDKKEMISYLIDFGKKLMNKEDYNILCWLKDFIEKESF